MNELKFNSQICTTKEQSQRLLELGLKPETADMAWVCVTKEGLTQWIMTLNTPKNKQNIDTPAWSLHRLMEIHNTPDDDCYVVFVDGAFDDIIDDIEWRINKGYLNKEYLYEETTGKENI
jgi:hypothetical protein